MGGLWAKGSTGGESDLRITDQKEKHLKNESCINWAGKTGSTQNSDGPEDKILDLRAVK